MKKYPISWQIPLQSIAKINFAAIVGSAFDEPVTPGLITFGLGKYPT